MHRRTGQQSINEKVTSAIKPYKPKDCIIEDACFEAHISTKEGCKRMAINLVAPIRHVDTQTVGLFIYLTRKTITKTYTEVRLIDCFPLDSDIVFSCGCQKFILGKPYVELNAKNCGLVTKVSYVFYIQVAMTDIGHPALRAMDQLNAIRGKCQNTTANSPENVTTFDRYQWLYKALQDMTEDDMMNDSMTVESGGSTDNLSVATGNSQDNMSRSALLFPGAATEADDNSKRSSDCPSENTPMIVEPKWVKQFRKQKSGENAFNIVMLREEEFTLPSAQNVFIATWNVEGMHIQKAKQITSLAVQCIKADKSDQIPTFIVLGIQGMDKALLGGTSLVEQAKDVWGALTTAVENAGRVKYRRLTCCVVGGLLLILFVTETARSNVQNVVKSNYIIQPYRAAYTERTGTFMPVINEYVEAKQIGACGIRLRSEETDLCFVNTALYQDADNDDDNTSMQNDDIRNQNLEEIFSQLVFPDTCLVNTQHRIMDHEYVFFFGSLNYTLHNLNMAEILEHFSSTEQRSTAEDFSKLEGFDQLHQLIASRSGLLHGLAEAGIAQFRPTYRRVRSAYSTAVRPSWADRVLHTRNCDALRYTSASRVVETMSNHDAVIFVATVFVKRYDIHKMTKIHALALDQYNLFMNEVKPRLLVEEKSLHFGRLEFRLSATRRLHVSNEGHLAFDVELTTNRSQTFVRSRTTKETVDPGQTVDIEITACVDENTADSYIRAVNRLISYGNPAPETIEDSLSVEVCGHKISLLVEVTFEYKRSVFGQPLSLLAQLTKPIQKLTIAEYTELIKNHFQKGGKVVARIRESTEVCKPIECIIAAIDSKIKTGLNFGKFDKKLSARTLSKIRNSIDTEMTDKTLCEEFSGGELFRALCTLLRSLTTPLVAADVYTEVCKLDDDATVCDVSNVFDEKLSPLANSHVTSVVDLCATCVIKHVDNFDRPYNLASSVARALLGKADDEKVKKRFIWCLTVWMGEEKCSSPNEASESQSECDESTTETSS